MLHKLWYLYPVEHHLPIKNYMEAVYALMCKALLNIRV